MDAIAKHLRVGWGAMKGVNNLSASFSGDKYKYRSQDLAVNGEA